MSKNFVLLSKTPPVCIGAVVVVASLQKGVELDVERRYLCALYVEWAYDQRLRKHREHRER